MIVPDGSFTSILEFGSALPVTTPPSCTTAKFVGVAGGVKSNAFTFASGDLLPAVSEAFTVSFWLSF